MRTYGGEGRVDMKKHKSAFEQMALVRKLLQQSDDGNPGQG